MERSINRGLNEIKKITDKEITVNWLDIDKNFDLFGKRKRNREIYD